MRVGQIDSDKCRCPYTEFRKWCKDLRGQCPK